MEEGLNKQLRQLKLAGIVNSLGVRNEYAIKSNLSYIEFLSLLVEDEISNRRDNSYKKRLHSAHFPYRKTLEEFDFSFQAKLNKKLIYDLAAGGFVRRKENIVFIGPPGVGKTHLAVAIGIKVLQQNYKVLFTTVYEMIENLVASKADNSYQREIKHYLDVDLLILDELGYKKIPQQAADEFFEIIAKRYEKGSIIITSNKSFKEWDDIFFDQVLATAIIDRIIHHCHTIIIQGESYRMKVHKINKEKNVTEENGKV